MGEDVPVVRFGKKSIRLRRITVLHGLLIIPKKQNLSSCGRAGMTECMRKDGEQE